MVLSFEELYQKVIESISNTGYFAITDMFTDKYICINARVAKLGYDRLKLNETAEMSSASRFRHFKHVSINEYISNKCPYGGNPPNRVKSDRDPNPTKSN